MGGAATDDVADGFGGFDVGTELDDDELEVDGEDVTEVDGVAEELGAGSEPPPQAVSTTSPAAPAPRAAIRRR